MVGTALELGDDLSDSREIRIARVGGRSVDAAEQQARRVKRRGDLGRELDPVKVAPEKLAEAGLVDRGRAAAQQLQFLRVDVDRFNWMAELGKAGCRDQPHPPDADDSERLGLAHETALRLIGKCPSSSRSRSSVARSGIGAACC